MVLAFGVGLAGVCGYARERQARERQKPATRTVATRDGVVMLAP
jgi:hypothetical protein